MVVIDTSVVLAVLLNEPTRPAIIALTKRRQVLVAPSLAWEVGNALVALVRRGRATAKDITGAWSSFNKIPLRVAPCDVPLSLQLAVAHHLYAYDAYVIEAARSARAPLMTLDARQREVAVACGVTILEVA